MLFRILGPLEVEGAGPLGGQRPRRLLRTLLLSANQVVPGDRLIDAVWGEDPPETARHALQVYVSQLRKAVPGGSERIRTEPDGYRLLATEDELDALRFERLVEQGKLAEALSLWRGPVEEPHLDALRLAAQEARVEAELELGRHAQLVPELERLVAEHPLRERLRRHLMLALYGSGRQADALAVYASTRAMLVEELGLEPGPELRELEAAILRQDPGLVARPAGVRLPAPVTPLIGRRPEIGEITELLGGEARLVTVTGPGGTGKTRVAIQAAAELAERFADGVVFVGLAALREPELVGAEIGAALGVEAGARDIGDALAEHLADRSVLLVMDNFEQVDDAAPLLSELLAAAPRLRLLVTSRGPLRLYGEFEFPLPTLRLEEEAMPLFLARARAAGASLRPDGDVARVCEALDCLPLAVELAAARARLIAPADMLERITSRLELASDGPRDAPDRHRTLQAAIAWSHDMLEPRLQSVFASLAAFAGGWDAEAAEVVASAASGDLEALADHSLVRGGDGRFLLLETIREFAAEHMEPAAAARHAAHFLELALQAERELRHGGEQSGWLDRLELEHDNLRAALSRLGDADPESELRMAGALSPFWAVRGHAAEGLERLERAIARSGGGETLGDAHALAGAATLAWIRGDQARSRSFSEQALALYRRLDDGTGIVRALANLGYVVMEAGELDHAQALYEECLAVARRINHPRSVTVALNCLTELALGSRDLARAREVGEESLALSREIGDQESTAVAALNLGYVALHEERREDAAVLLRDAAELFHGLGDREVTAHALNGLAACAERPEPAARLLGAAAAMRESVGGTHDFEPEVRERALQRARAELGEGFEAAYEAGRGLSLEEALSGL